MDPGVETRMYRVQVVPVSQAADWRCPVVVAAFGVAVASRVMMPSSICGLSFGQITVSSSMMSSLAANALMRNLTGSLAMRRQFFHQIMWPRLRHLGVALA